MQECNSPRDSRRTRLQTMSRGTGLSGPLLPLIGGECPYASENSRRLRRAEGPKQPRTAKPDEVRQASLLVFFE